MTWEIELVDKFEMLELALKEVVSKANGAATPTFCLFVFW